VLAPFSRFLLDGMIDFLKDRENANRWFTQVRSCGDFSETLLRFTYTIGRSPALSDFDPPRPLGQLQTSYGSATSATPDR
jgi:hypothetical protein